MKNIQERLTPYQIRLEAERQLPDKGRCCIDTALRLSGLTEQLPQLYQDGTIPYWDRKLWPRPDTVYGLVLQHLPELSQPRKGAIVAWTRPLAGSSFPWVSHMAIVRNPSPLLVTDRRGNNGLLLEDAPAEEAELICAAPNSKQRYFAPLPGYISQIKKGLDAVRR